MPRRAQEFEDHRLKPVDAAEQSYVRGSREYGELCGGEPGKVADDAATEKTEHLHRVFGPDDVGVSDDEQCRRPDGLDVLGSPARECAVQLIDLGDEGRPGAWIRCHPQVGLVPEGIIEIVRSGPRF
jgi:hypothetical protein